MTLLVVAVIALALIAAALACAVVVLGARLRAERARADELAASVVEVGPRPGPGALAGRAVRAVATTASRLRSGGVTGLLAESLDDLERWAREDRARIVRVAGPDGTVTVVFTDIVGSTPLNERLGDDRFARVLSVHEGVVRRAVERRGGHVVKNQGDGFMIVFGDPDGALRAAADIQRRSTGADDRATRRALGRDGLPVRIGAHTGHVVSRDRDFFGRNVAVAARVAALAGAGDILVTGEVIAAMTAGREPDGEAVDLPVRRLGARELKGVSGVVDVYTVEWRDGPDA